MREVSTLDLDTIRDICGFLFGAIYTPISMIKPYQAALDAVYLQVDEGMGFIEAIEYIYDRNFISIIFFGILKRFLVLLLGAFVISMIFGFLK